MIKEEFETGVLYHGDCFEIFDYLEENSIDAVLADLPYGTTYAKWDFIIDPDLLFNEYKKLVKTKAPIVLTAVNPFSALMITRRIKEFRYSWVWNKENASNFANAKIQPMKIHEDILVFGFESPNYYPIKVPGKKNHSQGNLSNKSESDTRLLTGRVDGDESGMKYPKSIIEFPKHSSQVGLHPTQKPVDLFEYLIKTYTKEGETVLDNVSGCGTTAIAAINTNRRWICIEKDEKYFEISRKRISNREKEGV